MTDIDEIKCSLSISVTIIFELVSLVFQFL